MIEHDFVSWGFVVWIAAILTYIVVSIPKNGSQEVAAADTEKLNQIAQLAREINLAMRDGRISPDEALSIAKNVLETIEEITDSDSQSGCAGGKTDRK